MQIIIKTTNLCNLNCEYCYHRYFCNVNREELDQTLSLEHAAFIFRRLRKFSLSCRIKNLFFIWHGGEPTLLPKDFYGEILDLQHEILAGVNCRNSMQSNFSVPLDEDYILFLLKNDFRIGCSFDVINTARDPANIHKAVILGNIKRFARYGCIPGCLTVVSPYNVYSPRYLFDFFYDHFMNAHFNRVDVFTPEGKRLSVEVEEYADFMTEMFHLWREKGFHRFVIGNLKDIARRILNPEKNSMCIYDKNCSLGRIHIAMNGDVFPCDNLSDQKNLIYGNIYDSDFQLEKMRLSHVAEKYIERERRIDRLCSKCEFYKCCYGGCPNDAIRSNATFFGKPDECLYYKRMFKLVMPYAETVANPPEKFSDELSRQGGRHA